MNQINSKIKSRAEISSFRETLRTKGEKVGFTSGVFDLLHAGHVDYLTQARAACDFLVVGVNADQSVKKLKGANRPLVNAHDRAQIIAALTCVDAVFIFDEENNNENINQLKPDFYFKASDYKKSELSSASLVEANGGKVTLIKMLPGYSSSSLIDKIQNQSSKTASINIGNYEKAAAIFVDRDGTLVEHVEYLHEPDKLKVFTGGLESLAQIKKLGYRIILITNQPGIGLGYFTKEDFFAVNKKLLTLASKVSCEIDRIYYCPHSKADNCACRKPATALIERAKVELNLDIAESFVVGDMTSDLQLAKNAGCKSVLVRTGQGGKDALFNVKADFEIDSIADLKNVISAAKAS